jgi:hypothetical protein
MGAQGTAEVDFGAFPGKSDASVVVTGQTGIVAGSLVEAWIRPADTADHLHDEHLVESIRVVAGSIVAGTGFTIYAFNTSQLDEPAADEQLLGRTSVGANTGRGQLSPGESADLAGVGGGKGTRIFGLWAVSWVWN